LMSGVVNSEWLPVPALGRLQRRVTSITSVIASGHQNQSSHHTIDGKSMSVMERRCSRGSFGTSLPRVLPLFNPRISSRHSFTAVWSVLIPQPNSLAPSTELPRSRYTCVMEKYRCVERYLFRCGILDTRPLSALD
jgi:hypothetical protein